MLNTLVSISSVSSKAVLSIGKGLRFKFIRSLPEKSMPCCSFQRPFLSYEQRLRTAQVPTIQRPRQKIAVQSLFGVRCVPPSSAGIKLSMLFVARLHLSMLPGHLHYRNFSKGGYFGRFVGFHPDNSLKAHVANLLQISSIGVSAAADGCFSYFPAQQTRLFECFHTSTSSLK